MSGRAAPRVLQPAGWAAPRGYSNGIAARGEIVCVGGQIGWNPQTGEFESDRFTEQAGQALRNIAAVLAEAGAAPHDVVRLTWYITDRDAYLAAARPLGELYRSVFGRHYPVMSVVVVAGLLEPRALVEIEATAVRPS